MKLSNHVIRCGNTNCNKLFTIYSDKMAILSVRLDDAEKTIEYCSKKCMEEQISNVNMNSNPFDLQVEVVRSSVVSEKNPFKMELELRVKDLKVEML